MHKCINFDAIKRGNDVQWHTVGLYCATIFAFSKHVYFAIRCE